MGASNAPLYDLIELSPLAANTTFTTAPGGGGDILGCVENATYTDSENNNAPTQITEINETTDADHGVLTIDGLTYNIQIATPSTTSQPVTVTCNDGYSTRNLTGDDGSSQVAFLIASPVGGGVDRYFMVVDDGVGDLADIISIQIRGLDWDPSGDDVPINLDQNNLITVCFTAGTLIETEDGPRAVETIRPGDRVLTLDHGPRPVLWAHAAPLRFGQGGAPARLGPIRIRRGALGPGRPVLPARPIVDEARLVNELVKRHRKNLKPLRDPALAHRVARAVSAQTALRLVGAA